MTQDMTQPSAEDVEEVDPVEVIHQGECQSLSGRSTLEFVIGRHGEDGTLHLAITGNSGGGMWCKDWASSSAVHDIVVGAEGLTAKSFHCLHAGRSINTGGFVLAALRELGLIRVNAENTRIHEHVPGVTLEKVVTAYMTQIKPEPTGRKTLRLKPKEG